MSASEDTANHYLSLLLPALKRFRDKVIIRPFLGGTPPRWGEVTFTQWDLQLATARLHWLKILAGLGLQQTDVVGLWLTGKQHTDLLNISSVSAAGYVPQLFSPVFPPDMTRALLALSGARALIYDAHALLDVPASSSIPTVAALDADVLDALAGEPKQGLEEADLPEVSGRQTAVIFHSSGTTCGMPKLIPTSHILMRVFMTHKFPDCLLDGPHDVSSNVFNSLGSLAHVGTFQAFHGAAAHGCTTVQASSMAMGSTELLHMVRATGLNRLVQYGTFVAAHIRSAMAEQEVADVLRGMRQVLYTGVALGAEEERWAGENGVKLSAMYGTSETGPLLISKDGPYPLRPCKGAQPVFVPHTASSLSSPGPSSLSLGPSSDILTAPAPSSPHSSALGSPPFSPGPSSTQAIRPALYEIVVSPAAPDAPPSTLFSTDGWWHTQDLFAIAPDTNTEDGTPDGINACVADVSVNDRRGWVYKGRAGDWIKTVTGFVDTRAIEDAVRNACADIVGDALVVGNGRAHPVLLVEALPTAPVDRASDRALGTRDTSVSSPCQMCGHLAEEVVRRLAPFNRTLFPYERIADVRWVLVLPPGALVRNREKGNVRRDACEEAFRAEIDGMFEER
ncbi:uncharacterized protein PHACADRAFT_206972 [Phanerochaete carnosa HHB-10118-sp]|uniref:AMP-dependent synthetase/ligase domain-containing protein n=1 Tax=Phanerochaete carnosa (strain HHB-10118-sp) TaxID=650164 RepID=K5WFP8_PHACS|nr:uncharacterized protein PHACADRAFT_206972 [Phanerochaete carnosa HHB-10118-sp]EKM58135.1 hypothetical protein PHACADRAFT_206972 [Phanerochaete carnosa HHB-10118-sp]